jgi:CarD family transcriptional regulator
MAQKMAPTKAGTKKPTKKPSDRKDARSAAASAKAVAKTKLKTPVAKTPAKPAAKPVAAKAHAPKAAAHAVVKPHAPARPHAPKAAAVKEAVKAPAKTSHAAPKPAPAKAVPPPPAAKEAAAKPALKPGAMPPPARQAPASGARAMPAAVAKAASQKIIAPASVPGQPVATPPPAPAPQQSAAAATDPKKPVHQRHGFKVNEWIVYPAHGVGRIVAIEEQEIAGISLELFVITFDKDKMTLRVPTGKSASVGMRKLAEEPVVKKAIETLKGRARVKRTMWSRRAQEYEAKINSGDLISIAEVVRDLYRSESQPEQSYSERQLYEAALDRMAREIAAVEKLDERGAVQRITDVLSKSARGRRLASDEAEEEKAA